MGSVARVSPLSSLASRTKMSRQSIRGRYFIARPRVETVGATVKWPHVNRAKGPRWTSRSPP